MGLWRCMNLACADDPNGKLGFDFEAGEPVCPKCGLDGRTDANAIVKREVIHYEEIARTVGNLNYGKGETACKPGVKIVIPSAPRGIPLNRMTIQQELDLAAKTMQRTSCPLAVTCPACRKTAEWQKAFKAHGGVLDFAVEMDLATQTIKEGSASSFAGNVGLQAETPPEILADKLSDEGREAEANFVRKSVEPPVAG